jgi:hypothetical protein
MERKNEMNSQPTPSTPDAGLINERVKTAVHSHRIILRVLTTVAFVFGFVAIATSIYIVSFYRIKYLPKQREMLYGSRLAAEQAGTGANSAQNGLKPMENLPRAEEFLRNEVVLTHVVGIGVAIVALAVGVLGLETLVLLTVVVLNRRVTLNQINANLAQISDQLRELRTGRGGT